MTDRQKQPSFQNQGEQHLREEALRMAKATQSPGQAKEQTKLIARGIEKGIALYKQQQKEKLRERDKARKKAQRMSQAPSVNAREDETEEDHSPAIPGSAKSALIIAGSIFLLGSLAHLLRWIMGWEVVIAGQSIPVTVSLPIAVIAALLAAWMYRAAIHSE